MQPLKHPASYLVAVALALVSVALLVGCGPKAAGPGAGGPPGGMPPPQVGVVTVEPRPVGLTTELPGRLEASRVAQVRARATGIVQKRLFREGSDVKAGQPLFEIDAAPYRATQQSGQAALARARANLTQAAAQAERFKPLVEAEAISKQEYISAVALRDQAAADVAAARASLQTAEINLGYASVRSPIAGRIGRALVTEGALVGQGEPTPLAVVQQINPLYLNFTQSTGELLELRRALASGKLARAPGGEAARVQVLLEDGSEYRHAGRLLFSDLTVDPSSGQVTLRAEVPNPESLLLPGMYVRVRMAQATLPKAILLPQQAVTRSAQGDTVLVVGADNKPQRRNVQLGSAQGTEWIVTGGLQQGEKVVVDGFQKMMVPGAPVNPVPWQPAGASGPSNGAAPAAARRRASGGAAPPPREARLRRPRPWPPALAKPESPPWPSSSSTVRSSPG